jgi:hypothetical protein
MQVTSDENDSHVLQGKPENMFRLAPATSAFPHPGVNFINILHSPFCTKVFFEAFLWSQVLL